MFSRSLANNCMTLPGNGGSTMNGQDVDMSSEAQQQQQQITVADIDAEFLPQIHDIVKTVEKDPQDAATKNKESLEASEKVKELNKKIERAREDVKKLPGISLTKEEQAAQLNALKKQLKVKQELLARSVIKEKRNFSFTNL